MNISPARTAAFRALLEVGGGHNSDEALHGPLLRPLDIRDRALATTLVMGVLRWQLLLDQSIVPRLRDRENTAAPVLVALRMGLFQLWFLDRVPAHAALAESVELVKQNDGPGAAGLVNAILRRIQREILPKNDVLQAQAPWMLERWSLTYGTDAAARIAAASQQEPVQSVRAAAGANGPQFDTQASAGAFLTRTRRLEPGDAVHGAGNALRIQDEGSQLIAEIAFAASPDAARVWDTCAAPGGKTAVLAELLPQAHILATDVSNTRLELMQRLLARNLAARVTCETADLTRQHSGAVASEVEADLVLCDAPCSGTGTLARNPEIRLRLQAADLKRQSERQRRILNTAWQGVAPSGVLVYSTCSLEPEENSAVVEAFQQAQPGAETVPMAGLLERMQQNGQLHQEGARLLLNKGMRGDWLQILPGVLPADGFFAAVFRKRG